MEKIISLILVIIFSLNQVGYAAAGDFFTLRPIATAAKTNKHRAFMGGNFGAGNIAEAILRAQNESGVKAAITHMNETQIVSKDLPTFFHGINQALFAEFDKKPVAQHIINIITFLKLIADSEDKYFSIIKNEASTVSNNFFKKIANKIFPDNFSLIDEELRQLKQGTATLESTKEIKFIDNICRLMHQVVEEKQEKFAFIIDQYMLEKIFWAGSILAEYNVVKKINPLHNEGIELFKALMRIAPTRVMQYEQRRLRDLRVVSYDRKILLIVINELLTAIGEKSSRRIVMTPSPGPRAIVSSSDHIVMPPPQSFIQKISSGQEGEEIESFTIYQDDSNFTIVETQDAMTPRNIEDLYEWLKNAGMRNISLADSAGLKAIIIAKAGCTKDNLIRSIKLFLVDQDMETTTERIEKSLREYIPGSRIEITCKEMPTLSPGRRLGIIFETDNVLVQTKEPGILEIRHNAITFLKHLKECSIPFIVIGSGEKEEIYAELEKAELSEAESGIFIGEPKLSNFIHKERVRGRVLQPENIEMLIQQVRQLQEKGFELAYFGASPAVNIMAKIGVKTFVIPESDNYEKRRRALLDNENPPHFILEVGFRDWAKILALFGIGGEPILKIKLNPTDEPKYYLLIEQAA